MPLPQVLAEFTTSVGQCEKLIANAHQADADGNTLLPKIDQQQITVAGFLNMFIAWETFLESSLAAFMTGAPTVNGNAPAKYVSPPTTEAARELVIGTNRYFDYANHQNLIKMVSLLFKNSYPFEPHLSAIYSDLDDLRTMRNASAHLSSTTQASLESLALRVFGTPQGGTTLYSFLTTVDPRSGSGETVFVNYKDKLVVTAGLIAQG